MKKFNKIMSIMLAVIMLFTAVARVNAENYNDYTPVNGTTFEFSKYLVTNVGAENPNAEFKFKITSGESVSGTESTVKQIAGPTPEKIKVSHGTNTNADDVVQGRGQPKTTSIDAFREFSVNFSSSDEPTVENGAAAMGKDHGGEVAVKKNIKLDFSDVTFNEPGVYRYIIQEVSSSNPDVEMDEKPYRTLDVYVEDNTTDTDSPVLAVKGYVLYENNLTNTPASSDSEFDSAGIYSYKNDKTGITEKVWTVTKDVTYTFTYDDTNNEWTVSGNVAWDGATNTPPDEATSQDYENATNPVESDYGHAKEDTTFIETSVPWEYTKSITTDYSYDSTNNWWYDDKGNTNVAVPDTALNNNVTFAEARKADYEEQKKVWDANKNDDERIQTYNPGNGAEAGNKTDKYVNKYLKYNLVVKKEVTGNQGSKDQFFKFIVEIDSGAAHKGAVITLETPDTVQESWKNSEKVPNNATDKSYTEGVIYAANTRDDDHDSLSLSDITNEAEARNYIWTNWSVRTIKYYWNDNEGRWKEEHTDTGVINDILYANIRPDSFYNGEIGQQIILDDNGKAIVTIFLQHAEQAKLLNLPLDTKYKVTEAESDKDGYKTTGEVKEFTTLKDIVKTFDEVNADANLSVNDYEFTDEHGNDYYYNGSGWTMIPADGSSEVPGSTVPKNATTTVYTETVNVINHRNGVIPTGVFVAAGTGFAILGVGIVGMLALSRRKEEDEEE